MFGMMVMNMISSTVKNKNICGLLYGRIWYYKSTYFYHMFYNENQKLKIWWNFLLQNWYENKKIIINSSYNNIDRYIHAAITKQYINIFNSFLKLKRHFIFFENKINLSSTKKSSINLTYNTRMIINQRIKIKKCNEITHRQKQKTK